MTMIKAIAVLFIFLLILFGFVALSYPLPSITFGSRNPAISFLYTMFLYAFFGISSIFVTWGVLSLM